MDGANGKDGVSSGEAMTDPTKPLCVFLLLIIVGASASLLHLFWRGPRMMPPSNTGLLAPWMYELQQENLRHPAMYAAWSRGNQCSDDMKTWWPARIEDGKIMCYMKDKP